MGLARLIEQGQLWRGQAPLQLTDVAVESSGYPELDLLLPGGGWQRGQLVELICSGEGQGELRLLWPLLRRIRARDQLVLWVDPPHVPYPLTLQRAGVYLPAQRVVRTGSLKERLWVLEQALKSGCCPLVLSWLDAQVKTTALRRLQLAAAEGEALGWMFRPEGVSGQSSPAAYRMHLQADTRAEPGTQVDLTLLKRRGGWPLPAQALTLPAVVEMSG